MRLGQQVRLVTVRGCMAHIHCNIQRARVVNFGSAMEYEAAGAFRFDAVELEDMETGARFWRPRLGWVERHGIMEYHV